MSRTTSPYWILMFEYSQLWIWHSLPFCVGQFFFGLVCHNWVHYNRRWDHNSFGSLWWPCWCLQPQRPLISYLQSTIQSYMYLVCRSKILKERARHHNSGKKRLGTVSRKKVAVLLDFVQMRGGGRAVPKFLVHFSQTIYIGSIWGWGGRGRALPKFIGTLALKKVV